MASSLTPATKIPLIPYIYMCGFNSFLIDIFLSFFFLSSYLFKKVFTSPNDQVVHGLKKKLGVCLFCFFPVLTRDF